MYCVDLFVMDVERCLRGLLLAAIKALQVALVVPHQPDTTHSLGNLLRVA